MFLFIRYTLFLLLVGGFQITNLSAQFSTTIPAGGRGAAMGRSGVNFTDLHAAFSNQAGLANVRTLSVGLVGTRPFSLADVNHFGAVGVVPVGSGTFALQAQYYGMDAYSEQRLGLAYGRTLVDGLRLGAQIDVLNLSIRNYGNVLSLTAALGLQYELFDDLQVGAHVFSPTTVAITEQYDLPTIFQLGIAYRPSSKILLQAEAAQEVNAATSFRAGLEYQLAAALSLRLGMASNPSLFTFGIGYQLENGLSLDVAASYHQVLGLSPTIGVVYVTSK